MRKKKSEIETKGNYSPGLVEGNYSVDQRQWNIFKQNARKLNQSIHVDSIGSLIIVHYGDEKNGETIDSPTKITLDFSRYLKQYITDYSKREIRKHYTSLTYSILKTEAVKKDKKLIFESKWINKSDSLENFIYRWLNLKTKKQISILGEFGTGKTTFCKELAFRLAIEHLENPGTKRIPILVSLKQGKRFDSIKNIIMNFFKTEWGLEIDYEFFSWLAKSGRLCVILDGFDEMAAKVDTEVRRSSFKMISELVEPDNKVIVSGRNGYFPNFDEMCKILGIKEDLTKDAYARIEDKMLAEFDLKVEFDAIKVNLFEEKQINHMLKTYDLFIKKSGTKSWIELKEIIDSTYDLRGLANRPILLDLIIHTVPELLKTTKTIDIAKLYEMYTNYWCIVDEHKGDIRRLQTSDQRQDLMMFLAKDMFLKEINMIYYQNIPDFILKHREISSDQELEWLAHDIRTCSFLKFSDDGYFEFAHNSFYEYFLAKVLVTAVKARKIRIKQPSPGHTEIESFKRKRILSLPSSNFMKHLVNGGEDDYSSQLLYFHHWTWAITKSEREILYCIMT